MNGHDVETLVAAASVSSLVARWAKTGVPYSEQVARFKVKHPLWWRLGAILSGGGGVQAGGGRQPRPVVRNNWPFS